MCRWIRKSVFVIGLAAAGLAHAATPPDTGPDRAPGNDATVAMLDDELARLMAVARQQQTGATPHGKTLDIASRPFLGAKDAAVAIVEFGSFECPYCRRHIAETMPQLKARYLDAGELLYVFYDIAPTPEHGQALRAAEAAHCAAEQDGYWSFREQLFRNPKALAPMFLGGHAEAAGLDPAALQACLDGERHREAVLGAIRLGRELRVRGTPTFFIGRVDGTGGQVTLLRRISGAQPVEAFAAQIDALGEELAQAGVD
jgi:protein-disulfide isomerase